MAIGISGRGSTRAALGFALVLFLASGSLQASAWKKAAALDLDQSAASSVMVSVAKQSTTSIVLDYTVPPPRFAPIAFQKFALGTPQRCDLGNARNYSVPGKPFVPTIYSRVIIPYGYTVAGVRLIPAKTVTLPDRYLLAYGERPTPASHPMPYVTKPDLAVYGSDAAYPGKTAELARIGYRCGVTIADIDIYPLSYRPKSGTVSYYPSFSIEVALKPATAPGTDLPAYPERLLEGIVTEENPGALATYSSHKVASGQTFSYIVITNPAIMNATTTPKLADLINLRTSQGFTCRVVSIDSIKQNGTGSTNKDKLRNFIKSAYTNWNTKYVLLGGDTNIIPMATINDANTDLPTHMYYQCLDQATWNNDYSGEVYIGQIFAQDAAEFSNQLYKIIKYETDPDTSSYIWKGLSFGEQMDDVPTFASPVMEDLEKLFSPPFAFDDFYEAVGVEITGTQVIAKINANLYSIWNHLGHANWDGALRIGNNDEKKFTNTNPEFIYSESCLWGSFDEDCFAERVTTSTRTGFFTVVANSREGFYMQADLFGGPSFKVHKSFWQACFTQGMNYLGEFNEYAHRVNPGQRWVIIESTLFGDPATKFRGKGPTPTLKVLAPNGGEKWGQKGIYNITWDAKFLTGTIKIELLRGTTATVLAAAAPCSTKTYAWTVGATQTIGTNYKVRLTSVNSPAATDMSDTTFAVTAPVGVVADNASLPAVFDMRAKGSKVCFQVPPRADGGRQRLSIVLYSVDGKTAQTLVNGTFGAGRYSVALKGDARSGLAAGTYLCKMRAANYAKTVPIVAVR